MPAKPRFVFDTNAIISAALLKQSVSRQAFDKALDEGEILLSVETIDELNRVLMRADFARYVTEEERLGFLALLLRERSLIPTDSLRKHRCAPPYLPPPGPVLTAPGAAYRGSGIPRRTGSTRLLGHGAAQSQDQVAHTGRSGS